MLDTNRLTLMRGSRARAGRRPAPGVSCRSGPLRGLLALSVAGQQRAHECPFVAEHTIALVPDAVGFEEVGIGAEPGSVLLVGSEAGEAE